MSETACRSGDAKLKTEAQRDCVFHCPSATSARYRAVERALVADTEPKGLLGLCLTRKLICAKRFRVVIILTLFDSFEKWSRKDCLDV
jgi:hypothetical protein